MVCGDGVRAVAGLCINAEMEESIVKGRNSMDVTCFFIPIARCAAILG